jgi:RimJ/RimL family protein N-acetyltransferase
MKFQLIGTNVDKQGNSFDVVYLKNIGGHQIEQMFVDQFTELVEQGLSLPMTHPDKIGKSKAIYAEQNNKILGFIIFGHAKETNSLWKSLSYVYPENRNKGIFKILHSYLDQIALDIGCVSITSHVHVNNHAQLEIAERLGLKKVYYLVGKYVK